MESVVLPEEERKLLSRVGAEVLGVHPVTPQMTRFRRATYRVELSDGRRVKLRRCTRRSIARRMRSILPLLPAQHFARILDSQGACLLEEWIPGRCLADGEVAAAELRFAGQLLASIHAAAPPDSASMREPALVLPELLRSVDSIARGGLISEQQRAILEEASRRLVPRRARWSVIHRDFAPDNLVVSQGRIVAIDNATVRFGFVEDDLATWWYRWPMSSEQRGEFLAGYTSVVRCPAPVPGDFWLLAAVTRAAAYRLRAGAKEPAAPLQYLPPGLRRV